MNLTKIVRTDSGQVAVGDGSRLQLRDVHGGRAQDQGADLRPLRGHPVRRAQARPPRPRRRGDPHHTGINRSNSIKGCFIV